MTTQNILQQKITLKNSDGEIASYTPSKKFTSILFSVPKLSADGEITVLSDDEQLCTVTLTSKSTSINENGEAVSVKGNGFGGMGGMGGRPQKPGGANFPQTGNDTQPQTGNDTDTQTGDDTQTQTGDVPQMPEGMTPPDGEMPQMPEGMTPPDGETPQMPEGMTPPQEETTTTDKSASA